MKLKKINKIWIGQYKLDVIWNKEIYNGRFDFEKLILEIGIKSGKENEIFAIILHEVLEAHCAINSMRVEVTNGDYLFNMSHKDFNTLIQYVSKTILDFIK